MSDYDISEIMIERGFNIALSKNEERIKCLKYNNNFIVNRINRKKLPNFNLIGTRKIKNRNINGKINYEVHYKFEEILNKVNEKLYTKEDLQKINNQSKIDMNHDVLYGKLKVKIKHK